MQYLKNLTPQTYVQFIAIASTLGGVAFLPIDISIRFIIAGVLIFALSLMHTTNN